MIRTSAKYTKNDVLKTYSTEMRRDEKHNQWIVYVFFRPVSLQFSHHLLNFGFSPTVISLLGLMVSFFLPLGGLILEETAFTYYLAGGIILFHVLDCIDGNIARTAQQASKAGAYLDLIVDVMHRLLSYLAIGMLAHQQYGEDSTLPVFSAVVWAVLAAWLMVAAKLGRAHAIEDKKNEVELYAFDQKKVYGWFDYLFFGVSSLDHAIAFLLPFALYFGAIEYLIVWLVAYGLIDFCFTQHAAFKRFK